ncbi:hypothetical protein [Streptomyces sp. NPDC000618]|uniref:hypothetical protein n=1 Tax=Streptomyces sp. NPDC000618 TaxID=3154265 RepID=UPI00331AAF8C
MSTRTTAAAITATLAIALVGCSSSDDSTDADSKATATASATQTPDPAYSDAMKAAGIPPEPTGAARTKLLGALAAVNPDIVRYEGKAIDAARNQCHSINDGGQNLDRSAAVRFTYKDVTTTEAQGKQLNDALKASGFCKV